MQPRRETLSFVRALSGRVIAGPPEWGAWKSPGRARGFGVSEAAKLLGLAPSTLRHQVKNGKLAARKVSRDWLSRPINFR